jgi:hypothetical protein
MLLLPVVRRLPFLLYYWVAADVSQIKEGYSLFVIQKQVRYAAVESTSKERDKGGAEVKKLNKPAPRGSVRQATTAAPRTRE